MKNLAAGFYSREDLIQAIEELEEELLNLPVDYPDSLSLKSPFDEEEDDSH